MDASNIIDFDEFWAHSSQTYRNHPTSRHRRRFVMRAIRKAGVPPHAFVFDYGCGPGFLLEEIQKRYGHVQHFHLSALKELLKRLGFSLRIARSWGFPLFTVQKWITKRNFDTIEEKYMTGDLTLKKRLIFSLAYMLYFMHDLLPWGPQIFILAKKDPSKKPTGHTPHSDAPTS